MNLVRFSVRNLQRNRRRTLATGAAIAVGVAALLFARGWIDGVTEAIREYATDSRLGAIQIDPAGYSRVTELLPVNLHLAQPAGLADQVRRVPGVSAVTQRIHFAGSLSNGERDTLVLVTAVDPEGEARVCPTFLTADLRAGRLLTGADTTSIVVGTELAAGLGLGPGAQVTLEARTVSGQINAIDVDVVGVASSSLPDEGKWLVVMPLDTARHLVGMDEDGGATALVVRLDHLERADAVARQLETTLGSSVEVRSWRQVGEYFDQAIHTFATAQALLLTIVGLLALLVIANTQMLSASERTREIGTLTALGAPRAFVRRMFILESFVLAVFAAIAGALLGAAACVLSARIGIPFKPPNQPVVLVRPIASLETAVVAAVAAMAVAVAGAVIPAWIGARKRPVEALKK
jgi:putative ABC transport system permease protein